MMKNVVFAGLGVALVVLPLLGATAPAFAEVTLERVIEVEGITEYRLSNGLKVLLFPDPSLSTVTVNVTYLVGSRHEGRGEKGMAHLLEHMVFKGTSTYENIWGALQDHGAFFNGTTWVDRTNYFETLPASQKNLEFALRMEADRMVNSLIDPEELGKEMTVVRNEFEMGENSPENVLQKQMMSAAYLWHNYGNSTIGNRSDIERVPAVNLRRFYEKYYQPDNAMLVVAGNYDHDWTVEKIKQYFGAIPAPERVLEGAYTDEPTQDGARHVQLKRVGSLGAAALMYHVPAGPHPDLVALDVLSEVLADRPAGRLYKGLVEADKVARVSATAFSWHDPGLLTIRASIRLDQNVEQALEKMIEIAEHVAGTVTEEEVERAKTKLLREINLGLADSERIGIVLSEWEAMGDWRLMFLLRDRLKEVTAADVNGVAEHYLIESNRTSGIYLPTDRPRRAEIPATPDLDAALEKYRGSEDIERGEAFISTAENIEKSTLWKRIGEIDLALLPKRTRGAIVHGYLAFPYGNAETLRGRNAAMEMLPGLMMRGTAERDHQGVRDELNRIETELSLFGQPGAVVARLKTTRENLPAAIAMLAEIMVQPAFPEDELEVLRKERLANLERMETDPQGLVFTEINRSLSPYPEDDVRYTPDLEGQIERVLGVDVTEIRELHDRFLGAGQLDASFVGDFDPDEVVEMVEKAFANWRSEEPYERIASEYLAIAAKDETIDTPDKAMAVVARATAFEMRDDDPRYPALAFANYYLGQSPKSRLMTALRHEGGLSYGAGSMLNADDEDSLGQMIAFAICAPENAKQAQAVMQEEFRRWIDSGLTAQEIEEFRQGYIEGFKTRLGDDVFLVGQLLRDLKIRRKFRFHERLVEAAEDLTADEIRAAIQMIANSSFVEYKGGDVSKFGDE